MNDQQRENAEHNVRMLLERKIQVIKAKEVIRANQVEDLKLSRPMDAGVVGMIKAYAAECPNKFAAILKDLGYSCESAVK